MSLFNGLVNMRLPEGNRIGSFKYFGGSYQDNGSGVLLFDSSSRILWQRLSDIPGIEISYKTGNGQVSTTTRSKDESECSIVLKDAAGSIFGMFVVMGPLAYSFHYYFHSDLLGSLVSISNSSGKLIESRIYDAWGRRRNPSDWEDYRNVPALNYSLRGYTFQEEMPEFGLVNLNGRLYDPLLGRMLSPDPYVQEPGMTQSYNRYSYCLNNPLKYTDTNGEFWHLIIGAVIGGIVNWGTHGAEFSWKGLAHFGIGAVSGALSAGIGSGISGVMGASINSGITFGEAFMSSSALLSAAQGGFIRGFASGAGAGFAGGLVSGTSSGLMDGDSLGKSLSKGLLGGLIGGASEGVIGGIISGIVAAKGDRNFWHGGTIELDVSMDLPQLYQDDYSLDCRRVSCQSYDEYYNGSSASIEELRADFPTVQNNPVELKDMYLSRKLSINQYIPDPELDKAGIAKEIGEFLKQNKGVSYEMKLDDINAHATAILRVRVYDNGRISVYLMNPGRGGVKVIRNFKKLSKFWWIKKF